MKNIIYLFFLFLSTLYSSQHILLGGGEYKFNEAKVSCLSEEQRVEIQSQLNNSIENLKKDRKISPINKINGQPKFIWPVRKSANAPYSEVWAISNFIDHNKNYPNQLLDWNCGSRTYDTTDGYNHQGIDIYLWPFAWQQVENNHAEVIAAADGVIIHKTDGNYDRNCDFSNPNWNAVYIRHEDGSVAWYGHMKRNSLTNKAIGENVKAGDFLGVVGSSGNSTGPHLHFEVYDSNNQLVETYQGNCNSFTNSNTSWWVQQKPYKEPRINAVMTHSSVPDLKFYNCPQLEIINISDQFSVGSDVIVSVYLADQIANSSVNIKVTGPDGISIYNFNHPLSENYSSSYWYWKFFASNFKSTGKWKFEATYNEVTKVHEFNYGAALAVNDVAIDDFEVFPNPMKDILTIKSKNNQIIEKVNIYDTSGKMSLYAISNFNNVDVSSLKSGIYILEIITNNGTVTKKVIK